MSDTQKIGLLTMPLQSNYGGIFQIMALQAFLNHHGQVAVIINRRYNESFFKRLVKKFFRINGIVDYKNIGFRQKIERNIDDFKRHHLSTITKPLYTEDQLSREMMLQNFDAVIVGSDQVWRPSYMQGIWKNAFFDFIKNSGTTKIAYAASFGMDFWDSLYKTDEIIPLLNKFEAVSVREESGIEICSTALNYNHAKLVVDPTLLVDREFYNQFLSKESSKELNGGLFAYVLDDLNENSRIVKEAEKQLKMPLFSINVGEKIVNYKRIKGYVKPSPETWLRSFYDAEFVITDSYHGVLFCIIFKKAFVAIANEKRGIARFRSLLGKLGLEDRLVFANDVIDIKLFDKDIDYDEVHKVLDPWIVKSRAFLLNNLAVSK